MCQIIVMCSYLNEISIRSVHKKEEEESRSREIFGHLFVCTFKSFDSIKYWAKFNDNFYILP